MIRNSYDFSSQNNQILFDFESSRTMKTDMIIKNTKVFTSDANNLYASALAVKDGRFVYVGDEAGISEYEGEILDLDGKFIMPCIVDSHTHISCSIGFEYVDIGIPIECESKNEVLCFIEEFIKNNPGQEEYRFFLNRISLQEEDLTKEDLDAVCKDAKIFILEEETHSAWVNSILLKKHNITDDRPDLAPGFCYYVRKDGHITGNVMEHEIMPYLIYSIKDITDDMIDKALERWIEYSVSVGVTCVFDAGIPDYNEFNERVYERLLLMDKQGKLPVYVDGCYTIIIPKDVKKAIKEVKRLNRKFDSEHLKVHTLKIFLDGTIKIKTAGMLTPYEGTNEYGAPSFNKEQMTELLKELNENGLDLHVHTVGERSSRIMLDSVEAAKDELNDEFRVKVTCAHLEVQDDADLGRFKKLGVFANYSPWWHAGNAGSEPENIWCDLLGDKRGNNMYRCKSVWDTGAVVTWSSDEPYFDDFSSWNPYLGMEVGMTRRITENTKKYEYERTTKAFPPEDEKMNMEEMILGYTLNGAMQLGIEDRKGSIQVGKDADFLVFDKDLLMAEHEGFSYIEPCNVYICGKKSK